MEECSRFLPEGIASCWDVASGSHQADRTGLLPALDATTQWGVRRVGRGELGGRKTLLDLCMGRLHTPDGQSLQSHTFSQGLQRFLLPVPFLPRSQPHLQFTQSPLPPVCEV